MPSPLTLLLSFQKWSLLALKRDVVEPVASAWGVSDAQPDSLASGLPLCRGPCLAPCLLPPLLAVCCVCLFTWHRRRLHNPFGNPPCKTQSLQATSLPPTPTHHTRLCDCCGSPHVPRCVWFSEVLVEFRLWHPLEVLALDASLVFSWTRSVAIGPPSFRAQKSTALENPHRISPQKHACMNTSNQDLSQMPISRSCSEPMSITQGFLLFKWIPPQLQISTSANWLL